MSHELDVTQQAEKTLPPCPSVAAQRALVMMPDAGNSNSR